MQGRLFVADDRGTVCPRAAFDQSTGCCTSGLQYTCQSCNKEDRCCSLFEHCVSCCLNPENNMAAELDTTFRLAHKYGELVCVWMHDDLQACKRTLVKPL